MKKVFLVAIIAATSSTAYSFCSLEGWVVGKDGWCKPGPEKQQEERIKELKKEGTHGKHGEQRTPSTAVNDGSRSISQ